MTVVQSKQIGVALCLRTAASCLMTLGVLFDLCLQNYQNLGTEETLMC